MTGETLSGLRALAHCARRFYLAEVEGHRQHHESGPTRPPGAALTTLADDALGLRGRVSFTEAPLRVVIDCSQPLDGDAATLPDDQRAHATASSLLLGVHRGAPPPPVELRAADGTVVFEPGADDFANVRASLARAEALRASVDRPPIHPDESACVRCPLVAVCLPDEARAANGAPPTRPLHPPAPRRRTLHVTDQGARVGRVGRRLRVSLSGEILAEVDVRQISDVAVHGHAQVSTQALRLCAYEGIPVHYMSASGQWLGAFGDHVIGVQRRLRQYRAVTDETLSLDLARQIVATKVEHQRRQLLRASRGDAGTRDRVAPQLQWIEAVAGAIPEAPDRPSLMGREGQAARAWFTALTALVRGAPELRPDGRKRRPPRDRFNALLSFGYGLLRRDMVTAISRVGLDPALGVLHSPRTAAPPLALDLMELFRVPLVDAMVLAAVNQGVFDVREDFEVVGEVPDAPVKVWLSGTGRKKLIQAYARRKQTEVRHPVLGYSLSFARMMELEVRLLEKAWSGEPGLFARYRPR